MYLYVHMVLSYSHTHGIVSDNNEANDDDGDEAEEKTRRGEARDWAKPASRIVTVS